MRRSYVSKLGTLLVVSVLVGISGCGSEDPSAPATTIIVDPDPDRIIASWSLVGPGGNTSGSGDATLSDMQAGNYSLTWQDIDGWLTPSRNPHNLTAIQGGSITFHGVYTPLNVDVVIINPGPDELNAPWEITGPGGLSISSQADTTLTNMAAGDYTLTWGEVVGWATPIPNPRTQTLEQGGFIEFVGQFTELPPINTVTIKINPGFIDAPWDLEWPDSRMTSSAGDTTLMNMPPGQYTLQWGDVVSYEPPEPNPSIQVLQQDGTITFIGNYSRFIRIDPSGSFMMGSPNNEPGRKSDERLHEVTLTQPFFISKTEVTQAEWNIVIPDSVISNPTYFSGCDECPVESVSWLNTINYCNLRSALEGYTPAYILPPQGGITWDRTANGYRLPTEAEWEYACRAGTSTAYYNGDIVFASNDPFTCYSDDVLHESGWFCYNSEEKTHIVGLKTANAFGLFDMHGNVWEWCWDYYERNYPTDPVVDPIGPDGGEVHVMRGGAWHLRAQVCRSASRGVGSVNKQGLPDSGVGFRVVRSIFD